MITREDINSLQVGQILYHTHIRNADGSALRCRVNGKPETWKRESERFRIPVKSGLKHYGEICGTGVGTNAHEWQLEEPAKWAVITVNGRRVFAEPVDVDPLAITGCQGPECSTLHLVQEGKTHLFRFWDNGDPIGTDATQERHLLFCSAKCLKAELAAQAVDRDARR